MNTTDIHSIEDIRKKAAEILHDYPISRAGLFGSVVKRDVADAHDIDMLIEIKPGEKIGYQQYLALRKELQDAFQKKIDLVQYKLVKPALRDYILPHEVRIYEENS